MKKMKRALSLVLALVMLMGMVMVPAGAVSNFTDADRIENTEAVAITSGLGLFAGTTSGEFAPKATVTRAQMATIIVKMLRGSDFNADSFKGVGVNPFPDTADFEGGWAEGYINACYQMGVVAGYGDGTFKPGKPLTTAEALTMIINALGVDPGPGEWPVTYMAKAEEMKLYGDMAAKPATDSPLNRDQLAVIVWEGLQYSPKGQTGWQIADYDVVFENYADALKAAGGDASKVTEAMGEDSLAGKVYELKTATGWITDNQATGQECTVLSDKNGLVGSFDVETGKDMLGHYVTVYYKEPYKSDKQPGEVYTVVDESTVVTVSETISSAKDYKAAFGSNCAMAGNGTGVMLFDGAYNWDAVDGDGKPDFGAIPNYTSGSAADPGTYIIVDGVVVAYIQSVPVTASYIAGFSYVEGEEKVYVGAKSYFNAEDNDRLVEYEGMAKGDFVTYVEVNGTCVLSPVDKVTGVVSKTSTVKVNGVQHDVIVLNGQEYPSFEAKGIVPGRDSSWNEAAANNKLDYDLSGLQHGQTYTLYVAQNGRYIGFEAVDGAVSSDTVYLLGNVIVKEKNQYGVTTFVNKGRGADLSGNEVLIPIGKTGAATDGSGNLVPDMSDPNLLGTMDDVQEGFYSVTDSTVKEEKEADLKVLTAFGGKDSSDSATYATWTWGTGSFSGNVSKGGVWTTDSVPVNSLDSTRYLIIIGEEDQDEPLTIESGVGGMPYSVTLTRADPDALLVTRNGMEIDLTAFVRVTRQEKRESLWVYVTPEQLASRGVTTTGVVYPAYKASTGGQIEVILDSRENQITEPGFAYLTEVDKGIYKRVKQNTEQIVEYNLNGDWTYQSPVTFKNVGYYQVTDQGFLRWTRLGGKDSDDKVDWIYSVSLQSTSVTSATVVDLRSDTQIRNSGVEEITSMTQLMTLHESDPGLMVVMDLAMAGSNRKYAPKNVFIKNVMRDTVGMNSIIYAESVGSDYIDGIVASARTEKVGESVCVYADAITDQGPGFYRYTVADQDANGDGIGDIVLVPFDASSVYTGTYGMAGVHNSIDTLASAGAGKLVMHAKDDCPGCELSCANTTFEALKGGNDLYLNENTLVYDAVEGDFITLDELSDLFAANKLYVDYYCSQGVYNDTDNAQALKDDTVELLVITGKDELYPTSCDVEDHAAAGHTAITAGCTISESGTYYLDADIQGSIQITGGDVTLCMCGHNITNSGGSAKEDAAIYVSGATLSLTNCKATGGIIKKDTSGNFALRVQSNATVTMDDGVHVDGSATVGLFLMGKVYMEGGTVSENTGYGVQINSAASGKFYMNGGTVSGNTKSGVCVQKGSFTMEGGTIGNQNITTKGAGVLVESGTFTMEGGSITGNTTSDYGGGVYVSATGTFTMEDGYITGNTAKQGAGVYNLNEFTLEGGFIKDNIDYTSGTNQGSQVRAEKGTFTMTGGSISNSANHTIWIQAGTAEFSGGSVSVSGNSSLVAIRVVSGTITFSDDISVSSTGTAVNRVGGTVTINGGTFTGKLNGTITDNR